MVGRVARKIRATTREVIFFMGCKIEKPLTETARGFKNRPGDYLLCHTSSDAVPSAQRGLTSLFGMGRGVSPALLSPRLDVRMSDRETVGLTSLGHDDAESDRRDRIGRVLRAFDDMCRITCRRRRIAFCRC